MKPELYLPNVALITGAAIHIGATIARILHENGWRVIIHYHQSSTQAQELAATLNQKRPDSAVAIAADLSDPNSYETLINASIKPWQRLDALINNASAFFATPFKKATLEEWNTLLSINTTAPFFLAQAAQPYLQKQQGSIINITDSHADGRPLKYHSIYSITKTALLMQTQTLARELAPSIRVNAVAPGVCEWNENALTPSQQDILSRTPLRRSGKAEEVARAVLYLLKDATYTTGSTLYVDGGRSLFN